MFELSISNRSVLFQILNMLTEKIPAVGVLADAGVLADVGVLGVAELVVEEFDVAEFAVDAFDAEAFGAYFDHVEAKKVYNIKLLNL